MSRRALNRGSLPHSPEKNAEALHAKIAIAFLPTCSSPSKPPQSTGNIEINYQKENRFKKILKYYLALRNQAMILRLLLSFGR